MKKCSKCGEVKPFEAFSKDASRKDGMQSYCKECNSAYHKANQERINELRSARYFANITKERDVRKAYKNKNRDKINERQRAAYHANIEKSRAAVRLMTIRIVKKMSDGYIRNLLTKGTGLLASDMPYWLVEAKREQLRLKRELRK